MLFFYVRHGDPIYNPDSLTPKGHLQAKALAKRFGLYGLDRVFTSTSNRAILTGQPTCELLGITPTTLPWATEDRPWERLCVFDERGIREYVFDDPEACKLLVSEDIRALGDRWGEHPKLAGFAACIEEIRADVVAFFESLGYRYDRERHAYIPVAPTEERVALFAHQAFGTAFMSCLLDIPYPLYATHFDMSHTGVTAVEFRKQNGVVIPRVLQLSNDSHLYREGLPTRYQNRLFF